MFSTDNPCADKIHGIAKRNGRLPKLALQGASCFALAMLAASSAFAIECQGNFQVQANGRLIATPYCQDDYLARVAQEYGISTCPDCIRSSLSEKMSVCSTVQFDNRVTDTCQPGGGTTSTGSPASAAR